MDEKGENESFIFSTDDYIADEGEINDAGIDDEGYDLDEDDEDGDEDEKIGKAIQLDEEEDNFGY